MGQVIKGIIDRFEEGFGVVEINGKTKDYPRTLFPKDAKPGDAVKNEGTQITVLKEETAKRRKEIENLMEELWED
ncbi:DUF3006 domain-containing protein [Peribacillus deserti]|uniref:DUF3006 domain-containing protein n=1 Tax=Peribacillus deserti TaxID=673318 RepID=A0A2N5M1K5_9BACI|nr:DUF3006 domain-containing protein [Peribacillus deserti]PLT28163.1 DUF3006 domain-containing protein [Peribacillus deserti]